MKTPQTNPARLHWTRHPLTRLLAAGGLLGATASGRTQNRAVQPSGSGAARPAPAAAGLDIVTGIVHSRLLRSGVPLGGIGTGTFQLRTDGTVGQADLEGSPNQTRPDAPGCFVALWTRADTRATSRVLALRSGYGLPTVTRLDYDGLYPQANLLFPDVASPVQASLLAFSPLVPFDLKNSSFPAVAFVLRLKNTTTLPVEASGLVSWESLLSGTGVQTAHAASIFPSAQGFFRVHLGGAGSPNASAPLVPSQPQMTLTAFPQRAQTSVTVGLWDAQDARPAWWDTFARDGSVPDGKPGQTAQLTRPAACIAVRLTLKPGETVELPFAVSWYVPHLIAPTARNAQTTPQPGAGGQSAEGRGDDVGHYYQVAFDDADAAAMQLLQDWRSLYALTEEWQKRLLFSNMPRWMARRIINAAAPLSTHAIHTRDGRFALLDFVGNDTTANAVAANAVTANSTAANGLAGSNRQEGKAGAAQASGAGAASGASVIQQAVPDAYLSERDATFAHQSADALLLALFPQLAAQELAQFTALQNVNGFVVPPAGADWPARIGPPAARGGPLIPDASGLFVLPDLSKPAKGTSKETDGGANRGGDAPSSAKDRSRGKMPAGPSRSVNQPTPSASAPVLPPPVAALDPIDATAAYVVQAARFLLWTGDPDDIKRFYPGVWRATQALLRWKGETAEKSAAGGDRRQGAGGDGSAAGDALNAPARPPASLSLRLAALRAGQRVAQLAGEAAFAAECDVAARQGSIDMEARFWNGEFYQTRPRAATMPDGKGKNALLVPAPDAVCATDQLWGQWLAYQLDLGPLLPPDHLLKAAQSVQRRNDRAGDVPASTAPPFSLLPPGGALLPPSQVRADGRPLAPDLAACLLPASLLADASVNIWQDQPEIGVALLRRLEEGRDSVLRSPWQTPARVTALPEGEKIQGTGNREQGTEKTGAASGQATNNRQQATSSINDIGNAGEGMRSASPASLGATADWNLLYALEGFALDMNASQMTLAPNIPGTWRTFAAPIFAPTFWGYMEYRPTAHGGVTSFRLDRLIGFVTTPRNSLLRNRAELTLKTLRVLGPPRLENNVVPTKFEAYVSVGQRPIGCRATQSADGYITLAFDSPLTMTAGDRLEVDVH